MELNPTQFNYKEENFMDKLDQRRKESGIRLHYSYNPHPLGIMSQHGLYATHNDKVVGSIHWDSESGEVDALEVHPKWRNTIVPHTLLRGAIDMQFQGSKIGDSGTPLQPSSDTTEQGYGIVKKLAPKDPNVLNPSLRNAEEGDSERLEDWAKGSVKRLGAVRKSDFACMDCGGAGEWDCESCNSTGIEKKKSTSVEKFLNWE